MKMMSVDIEIADVFDAPEGTDIDQFAPFHVSVAATAVPNGAKTIWYSRENDGKIADHLSKEDAGNLLRFLRESQEQGYRLFAWNGLSFDMKWIGYAAQDLELARAVALDLYDPMLQFFVQRGFPIGLAKAAQGLKLEQVKSMSGADAPKEWIAGNHGKVMDYVIGDCEITNAVVQSIAKIGSVRWITQKGFLKGQEMREFVQVRDLIGHSLPDQSWMDAPIPMSKFSGWLTDGGFMDEGRGNG